jgi:hypothetical protein
MQRQSLPRRSGARLLALFVVALVAAAAVAAAPAAAVTTSLNVSPQSANVKWGAKGILNGVLSTTENPPVLLDRQQVEVKRSTYSVGPWTSVGTVTNTVAPYTSGEYTYSWTAARNYYWTMTYAGFGEWAPVDGTIVLVKVTPAIGKPSCPSSIRAKKKFTVSGQLKPKYPSGYRTVTVKAQCYSSGKWRPYKSYAATNANSGSYTKYSVRLSISKKGKYRFYATTLASSTLAAGKSVYSRTLRVN